jgi:hypothetical protein
LIISAEAVWDGDAKCAAVKQFGQRLGMEAFKPYFKDMEDKSAADLKVIYTTLKSTYADLPAAGSKAANAEALQKYESEHPELCALIPSEDQFYGVSRGANRLAKYIQWVFIPAIKDAASEQTESKKTALGQLALALGPEQDSRPNNIAFRLVFQSQPFAFGLTLPIYRLCIGQIDFQIRRFAAGKHIVGGKMQKRQT